MVEKNLKKSTFLLLKSRREALGLWIYYSIVASLLVGRGFPPIQPTLLSLISIIFVVFSVYIYNDVIDMDADKNNKLKSNRPLATGEVTKSDAMKIIYISGIVGLSLSYLNSLYSFGFTALFLIIFGIYSYPKIHLKKIMVVKELVIVSGFYILNLSVSYALIGSYSSIAFIGTIFFSIFAFFVMPATMDSTDIDADRIQGVHTLASIMSWKRRLQLVITGMLLIMTLTPLTYKNFGFNVILPIGMVLSGLVLLRFMVPLMLSVSPMMNDVDTMAFNLKIKRIIISFNFILALFLIIGTMSINIPLF
jgi:4-hydroxybenzoate polyprenyltransferase